MHAHLYYRYVHIYRILPVRVLSDIVAYAFIISFSGSQQNPTQVRRTHKCGHVAGWSDHERDFLGSEQAHLNGVLIVTDFSIAHRYPGACGGAKGNLSHFEITL